MPHKWHARDHLLQQCSQAQCLCISYCKHLKIPLVKCVSAPPVADPHGKNTAATSLTQLCHGSKFSSSAQDLWPVQYGAT